MKVRRGTRGTIRACLIASIAVIPALSACDDPARPEHESAGRDEPSVTGSSLESGSDLTALVTGIGALPTRNPRPGNWWQEFDFEATDTSGWLYYTDWSIVRPDSTVATVTVDPTADPSTAITSFIRSTSDSTCVTFSGTARLDTEELVEFEVEACDRGVDAPNDHFAIRIPSHEYVRGDWLSEGEITLAVTGSDPSTRITGLGAIGTGRRTPGRWFQEFDFQAIERPYGRLSYTDWSIVRPDGTVATVTVDPTADPSTAITSLVRSTTDPTCVTFGGTARLDTEELVEFEVEACDRGVDAPNDEFTIRVPSHQYARRDWLSEGEITLAVADPSFPKEPAGFGFITERPFDAQAENDWLATTTSGFSIVSDAAAPESPSFVGQMFYPAGTYSSSYDPGWTEYESSAGYTSVYLSFWLKLSPNFQGNPIANKVFYSWTHSDPVFTPVFLGEGDAALHSEMRVQNTSAGAGGARNLVPNLSNVEIVRGTWQHWEILLVSNTGDNADGQIHWWIDAFKVGEYRDVIFGSSAQSKSWDRLSWRPIWGGSGGTVVEDMYMWMDHFYASGSP